MLGLDFAQAGSAQTDLNLARVVGGRRPRKPSKTVFRLMILRKRRNQVSANGRLCCEISQKTGLFACVPEENQSRLCVIRVYDEAGNAIETHEHSLLPNGAMLLRNSLSNIAFIWSSERRKACRPCRA